MLGGDNIEGGGVLLTILLKLLFLFINNDLSQGAPEDVKAIGFDEALFKFLCSPDSSCFFKLLLSLLLFFCKNKGVSADKVLISFCDTTN